MNLLQKAVALGKKGVKKAQTFAMGLTLAVGVGVADAVNNVAMAAVPTEATTAITGLATDGAALIAEFWPVATAIVVGLVLFKLFKKGTGAAT